MRTNDETITEAKEAEAFIRRLEIEWLDLKEQTKEKKDEMEQAVMHLRQLFAAEANDSDRPLLDDQDADDITVPVHHQ
jgi:hypothetical protein